MSGSDARALSRSLLDLCRMRKLTIATAESCTGGLVAGALTDLPGSSAYFSGSVVAYTNEIKRERLGVAQALLDAHGAVSAEVAQAMAEGVRGQLGTDYAVSVTGIAGPDADGSSKPVGLTHLWFAGATNGSGRQFVFGGDRAQNRASAVLEALRLALDSIAQLDVANTRS